MTANKRIVDLSHIMVPGKEEYGLALETNQVAEVLPEYPVDDQTWYILQRLHMSSHCGTHIEFPYHHNRNGMHAAAFPVERLIGWCVLLDYRHKTPNQAVTLEDLVTQSAKIQKGDMVLFNFGCARKYGTAEAHERPYIAHEALKWLVSERSVNIVGSDASGIEIKGAANQPNHQFLMDNQIPIIEFANNLDALRAERFTLIVLALPVQGLDSCPVRLVAIEEGT